MVSTVSTTVIEKNIMAIENNTIYSSHILSPSSTHYITAPCHCPIKLNSLSYKQFDQQEGYKSRYSQKADN